jgi:hypothetical protein
MIATGKFAKAPHIRMMVLRDAGPLMDLSASASFARTLFSTLTSAQYLDAYLTDLITMCEVLEGITGTDTTTKSDVIAMKEVFEYASGVENFAPAYRQGLPVLMGIPGLIEDDSLLNDFYCRSIYSRNAGNNQVTLFPVVGMTVFGDLIPVKGFGSPGINEFTLMGGAKTGLLDSTQNLSYTAATDEERLFGTDVPVHMDSIPTYDKPGPNYEVYTREDADELLESDNFDFNDGTAIRTFINGAHPHTKHIYFWHLWASLLTTDIEYRALNRVPTDYEIWMNPDDLGVHHAMYIATSMGLPYYGS